jgi:hypothetical protein
MIKVGEMEFGNWLKSLPIQDQYSWRECSINGLYQGSLWVDQIAKDEWTIHASSWLKEGFIGQALPKETYSSQEKAKQAVDDFLARMQKMIAFI